MKSLIATLLLSSAAIMVGGCGGSHVNTVYPSLYAGNWTGTWTGPEAKDGGAFTFVSDAYGNMTGTMARTGALSGTVDGFVDGTGKWTATTVYTSSGNFTISGRVALTSVNSVQSMTGTFTYWWNGTLYDGTFTTSKTS